MTKSTSRHKGATGRRKAAANPQKRGFLPSIGRVFGGERVSELDLSTREIVGHLQVTGSSLWAWYQLGPVSWSFTTTAQRVTLWDALRTRLARLAGYAIKLRTTSRPYPAYEFARSLDLDTPHPLPDVSPELSFDAYLEGQQRSLHRRLLDEKVVVLGVRVGPAPKRSVVHQLAGLDRHPPGDSEVGKLLKRLADLSEIVAGAGLRGRPLDAEQMAWLMHRSVGIGMPVPVGAGAAGQHWEHDDLFAFTDPVQWYYTPMGPTVRVTAVVGGQLVERHVAVLTVGRMNESQWPENGRDPWMMETDRLSFPVEWSMSGQLVSPRDLASTVEFERNRAVNIEKHYEEHGELPPQAAMRAIEQATEAYDEVTEGDARVAVRFAGPIRLAVHGETEEVCLSRARTVVDRYAQNLRIEIAHPHGQRDLLREFIPGEPWSQVGYQRRMPVGYLAAAIPNVSSSVGTTSGHYFAYTIGSAHRAVRHDGHLPMEKLNMPGLVPLVGEPGCGKSYTVGTLAYHAARRGQWTVVLDPSGPLARLCDLPELAPFSRRIDLSNAEPGTLAPWQLVPEPKRHHFDADRDFDRAVQRASHERVQLAFDIMRMLLPQALLSNAQVDAALRQATREVGGGPTVNPNDVITRLRALGTDVAKEVAACLQDAAEFPLCELIFPEHHDPIPQENAEEKTLTVITLPGLQTPDTSVPRTDWSSEEVYSVPLLHLAAFFTSRSIYKRDRNTRKNLFLDENEIMSRWGSGRALFIRLSRDSRKWNTAIYASSQHPDDHLGVGKLDALIGAAMVGRIEDEAVARTAMRLLRTPAEYAPAVMRLSPKPPPGQEKGDDDARNGEFLYRDAYGQVEKIHIDSRWHPALHELLSTTPKERNDRRVGLENTAAPIYEFSESVVLEPA